MRTPYDPARARVLANEGTAVEAVLKAWMNPGDNPEWHRRCRLEVGESMPVLALALDRLARETEVPW